MATHVDISGPLGDLTPEQLEQLRAEVNVSRELRNQTRSKPMLPHFSGESQPVKGSVTFRVWRHAVMGLQADGGYGEYVLIDAIRRSLSGQAAQVLTSLDYAATSIQVMEALELAYGDVSDDMVTWQHFYNARQLKGESLISWYTRLQELLREASRGETLSDSKKMNMMKSQLWTYLYDASLREAARHKFDDSNVEVAGLFKYLRQCHEAKHLPETAPRVMVSTQQALDPVELLTKQVSELSNMVMHAQHVPVKNIKPKEFVARRSIMCFSCGKVGHIARECRSKRTYMQSAYQNMQQSPHSSRDQSSWKPQQVATSSHRSAHPPNRSNQLRQDSRYDYRRQSGNY